MAKKSDFRWPKREVMERWGLVVTATTALVSLLISGVSLAQAQRALRASVAASRATLQVTAARLPRLPDVGQPFPIRLEIKNFGQANANQVKVEIDYVALHPVPLADRSEFPELVEPSLAPGNAREFRTRTARQWIPGPQPADPAVLMLLGAIVYVDEATGLTRSEDFCLKPRILFTHLIEDPEKRRNTTVDLIPCS
jgi:hypothetical protein